MNGRSLLNHNIDVICSIAFAVLVVRSQLLKDDVARELGDLVTVFSSRVQEYVVALDGQKRKVAIATDSPARFMLVWIARSHRLNLFMFLNILFCLLSFDESSL